MPTTRRRRARKPEYSAVVRALLAHDPIERTTENRKELEQLRCQGYLESPTREYPFLVGWAAHELERWGRETH
jgi:hypothetical protein